MSNQHSRINVLWRWLIAACAVLGLSSVPSSFAGVAAAATPPGTVVVYNPTGSQCNCTPVPPSVVAPGFSATNVSQVGMLGSWSNTDVWPVGQIGSSSSINLGQYVSLSVTPSAPTKFETLTYSKQSYLGQGPQNAAVRTSLNGFATNVASVSGLNPAGLDQITFNMSNLPIASSQVEFRIYFFNAPSTGQDWADLVSTNRGGTGLTLTGEVIGWNQSGIQPTTP
jgi:hypothetical protein